MKHVLIVPLWLVWSFAFCQTQSLNGVVQDESTGEKIPSAVVQIENSFSIAVTDYEGTFELKNLKPGSCRLVVSHISFEKFVVDAVVPPSTPTQIKLKRKIYLSDAFMIIDPRIIYNSPMAFTNISNEELGKNNLGQDMPYLLNFTPSVVVTSDAGTGIGYTGIRVRGTDATRVNVTINGVPV